MLEVKNLFYSYNGKDRVLEDINFKTDDSSLVGILGKNGVGKTTLMRCIVSLVKVKEGEIYLDGINLNSLKLKEKSRLIGYVPQNIIFSDATVFDSILIGRRPYFGFEAGKTDLEIVNSIIEDLKLKDLAFKNVNNLSGGERQKVAIARALVKEPKLLYLDEPTSNLDIKNQIEVLGLIRRIAKKRKITVLVNIHDLNLAMHFFDSLIILNDNKIIKTTIPEKLEAEDLSEAFGIEASIVTIDDKRHIILKEGI